MQTFEMQQTLEVVLRVQCLGASVLCREERKINIWKATLNMALS